MPTFVCRSCRKKYEREISIEFQYPFRCIECLQKYGLYKYICKICRKKYTRKIYQWETVKADICNRCWKYYNEKKENEKIEIIFH